jgi:hypothetical protein
MMVNVQSLIDSAENLAKDIQRQKEILEEVQKKVSILINLEKIRGKKQYFTKETTCTKEQQLNILTEDHTVYL